jgi:lipid II:glycine glycyltransferase (peptidoglycan interpeptide bridge formation enzyme)
VSEAASLGNNVAVLVAETPGRIHAAAIVPFSEPCAYYMHGGSAADASPGAMNLLQWEAMKYFKSLGVMSYNFVGARLDPKPGSKQEGIVNFKKRFGGFLVRGIMWKYVLDPSRAWAYSLAVRLRSRGDVVDQERHKLRLPIPTEPRLKGSDGR